jgi:aminoglycoside phosphotransferase (APT) family kinase protein
MRAPAPDLDPESVRRGLAEVLTPVLGPLAVRALVRLKGGYSRQMWSFDALTEAGGLHPLILCTDTADGVVGAAGQTLDRVREAVLLHTLHAQGVPVPDGRCAGGADGSDTVFGRPFLVMDRGPGTAAIGPLHKDPWYVEHRAQLGDQLASMLAAIHGAEVGEDVLGPRPPAAEVADREVRRWTTEARGTPAACTRNVSAAIDWLATVRPDPPPVVTLVHGDYRTGNLLHDPGSGLHTVLDWEMAHWGDPWEDVAWARLVCWRLGTDRVGGLVPMEEWPRLYGAAAGRAVDAVALAFWDVVGSVKMICLVQRAAAVVKAEGEQRLLTTLFADLDEELGRLVASQRLG